jgi:hypothetical protein
MIRAGVVTYRSDMRGTQWWVRGVVAPLPACTAAGAALLSSPAPVIGLHRGKQSENQEGSPCFDQLIITIPTWRHKPKARGGFKGAITLFETEFPKDFGKTGR